MSPHQMSPKKFFLKRQFFKLLGSNMRIYTAGGDLAYFVHQKAFRLKEDIRVYADEAKTREVMTIRARQIIDFSAAYDVYDTLQNVKVGALKRKGWSSLIRDAWIIMDPHDREIGQVHEDRMLLALVRRFLTNLVPQSYWIDVQGHRVCELRQHFNPFLYKLDIDLSFDRAGVLDERVAIATAVLMATIEGRQG
jgi:uncharacterized protein YxjI